VILARAAALAPGHDGEGLWWWLALAVLLAGIAYATLGPEAWQIRLGLPYLVEHFLAYSR
jgi:hypothetical protein